jgi:endo-1,4-beta-xylanase
VLRVIDAFGQSDEDTTAVGVVDTTAPPLSLSVAPTVLSPPNHKLVPVTVTAAVSDVCDPSPTLRLVSITSNEGDPANGSGHTSPDIQDAQFDTDDRQFLLRAERSGGGSGRIYTITYEAEDASGNVAVRQVTVAVP